MVLTLYLVVGGRGRGGPRSPSWPASLAAWPGRRLARPPGPTFARNLGLLLAVAGLVYLALLVAHPPAGRAPPGPGRGPRRSGWA